MILVAIKKLITKPVVNKGDIPNSIRLPLFDANIYQMKKNGSDYDIYGDPNIGI